MSIPSQDRHNDLPQMFARTIVKESPGKMHPQDDCPLFKQLPSEVRNSIWRFALMAYDDKEKPYEEDRYYTRPGYRYHSRMSFTLLQTCRRIYLEAHMFPVIMNEIVAWCYRVPPDGITDPVFRLVRMRPEQLCSGLTIHLFTQQYWLEDSWPALAGNKLMNPKTLHITFRHTDWWYWENREPIVIDPKQRGRPSISFLSEAADPFQDSSWGAAFRQLHGLGEFKLELETVITKQTEMGAIVAQASTWQFPLGDNKILVLDESKTTASIWTGPHKLHLDEPADPIIRGALSRQRFIRRNRQRQIESDRLRDKIAEIASLLAALQATSSAFEPVSGTSASPAPDRPVPSSSHVSSTVANQQPGLGGRHDQTHDDQTFEAALLQTQQAALQRPLPQLHLEHDLGVTQVESGSQSSSQLKAAEVTKQVYYVITLRWFAR